MKNYALVDLTGDKYLNPGWPEHQRNIGAITSISVHHNAVPREHDYDSVAQYRGEAVTHYQKLGPGLQYHFCIDNVGTIFKIRPLTTWLHVVGSSENTSCIAICLDGNFENQEPTREQFEALFQLLLDLCEHHPEFPATWPDVRPHADYSPTACCGAKLKDNIYPIKDQATAKAQLLNQGVFDWPELQPSVPKPPVVTPPIPPTIVISYRVKDSSGKQVGAYTVDKNAWKKHQDTKGSKVFDQKGNDVTAQLDAKFNTPVPTPTVPQQSHDYGKENNDLLKQILALIQSILTKLNVFK